jgi:hypothetical protein
MWYVKNFYYFDEPSDTSVLSYKLLYNQTGWSLLLENDETGVQKQVRDIKYYNIASHKEFILGVLKSYKIVNTFGFLDEYIMRLSPQKLKLLNILDYHQPINARKIRNNKPAPFILKDLADNLIFDKYGVTLSLVDLILQYPDCWIIQDDLLILLPTYMGRGGYYTCYKIECGEKKFRVLVTKISILEG